MKCPAKNGAFFITNSFYYFIFVTKFIMEFSKADYE